MLQGSMLAEKSQFIWVPARRLTVNITHTVWTRIGIHAGVQIIIVNEAAERLDIKSRNLSRAVFCSIKSFGRFMATGFGSDDLIGLCQMGGRVEK